MKTFASPVATRIDNEEAAAEAINFFTLQNLFTC